MYNKQFYVRDNLLKVARRFDNANDWANHRAARNKAVSSKHLAKRQFYNSSFEENKHNTRAIWKAIKTLTGSKRNTKEVKNLNVNGRDMEDSMEMAECSNACFFTIADKLRDGLRQIAFDISNLLTLLNFVRTLMLYFLFLP